MGELGPWSFGGGGYEYVMTNAEMALVRARQFDLPGTMGTHLGFDRTLHQSPGTNTGENVAARGRDTGGHVAIDIPLCSTHLLSRHSSRFTIGTLPAIQQRKPQIEGELAPQRFSIHPTRSYPPCGPSRLGRYCSERPECCLAFTFENLFSLIFHPATSATRHAQQSYLTTRLTLSPQP